MPHRQVGRSPWNSHLSPRHKGCLDPQGTATRQPRERGGASLEMTVLAEPDLQWAGQAGLLSSEAWLFVCFSWRLPAAILEAAAGWLPRCIMGAVSSLCEHIHPLAIDSKQENCCHYASWSALPLGNMDLPANEIVFVCAHNLSLFCLPPSLLLFSFISFSPLYSPSLFLSDL